MKNQYFGDEHDFKKYMLLRSFLKDSDIPLLVAWYLTPDEKKNSKNKNDGNKRAYLEIKNGIHSQADDKLFDWLQKNHKKRDVQILENAKKIQLAHNVAFFSDMVPTKKLRERSGLQTCGSKLVMPKSSSPIPITVSNLTAKTEQTPKSISTSTKSKRYGKMANRSSSISIVNSSIARCCALES